VTVDINRLGFDVQNLLRILTARRGRSGAVRIDQSVRERRVTRRAGGGRVDLDQQRESDRERLIESQHRLGDVAQFIDDGIAGGRDTRDDAAG